MAGRLKTSRCEPTNSGVSTLLSSVGHHPVLPFEGGRGTPFEDGVRLVLPSDSARVEDRSGGMQCG